MTTHLQYPFSKRGTVQYSYTELLKLYLEYRALKFKHCFQSLQLNYLGLLGLPRISKSIAIKRSVRGQGLLNTDLI